MIFGNQFAKLRLQQQQAGAEMESDPLYGQFQKEKGDFKNVSFDQWKGRYEARQGRTGEGRLTDRLPDSPDTRQTAVGKASQAIKNTPQQNRGGGGGDTALSDRDTRRASTTVLGQATDKKKILGA